MPKIGMRMIKTAIAVFLCFSVDLIRENGIVFYSVIAAILCMQPEISDTIKQAKVRMFATILGGFVGMIFLIFESSYFQFEPLVLRYLVLSLMVIPLIYLNVLIKKPSAAYLTCVVFLSITVSHVNDLNPALFAFNRVMDTLIGIGIAYFVNCFHLPHHARQKHLVAINLNPLMVNQELDGTLKYQFNQWLDRGEMLTFTSTKIYVVPFLKNVRLNFPLVLLDGAIAYDPKLKHYMNPITIDDILAQRMKEDLASYHLFVYEYNLDKLVVHHRDFETPAQQAFYDRTHLAEYHFFYYHTSDYQVSDGVVAMMLIEPKRELEAIRLCLKPFENEIRILIEEEIWLSDAIIIRIICASANQALQIAKIQENTPNEGKAYKTISESNVQKLITNTNQELKSERKPIHTV